MFLVNRGRSKRGLLIVIITILLLGGFIVTNAVSFLHLKNSLRTSIVETQLPKSSAEAYSELSLSILPIVVASSMLANDRYIQQWLQGDEKNSQDLIDYLIEVRDNNGALISFLVSDKSQQYFNSEGVVVFESQDDPQANWYFDFKNSDKTYELNLGPNIDEGQTPTVFINYKINYQGNYIGTVGLGIELKVIKEILNGFKRIHNQNIYFIDGSGQIVSQSAGANLTANNLYSIPEFNQSIESPTFKNSSNYIEYNNGQGRFILNLRYIPELNWWMLIEQAERQTFRQMHSILYTNIAIGLVVILFTLLIVSWVVNYFHKQLETLARVDALTGIDNRQAFEEEFDKALSQSNRSSIPISLLMIDVDRFKEVNDDYGHLAGDHALKVISTIIVQSIRRSDAVGRWGGEEFVIMAHNDELENAHVLAEKIRKKVEQSSAFPRKITISIGVAQARANEPIDTILSKADIALYKAKNDGRNCVRSFKDSDEF